MRISILTIGAAASIIAINSVCADTTTSTVTSKQYVDSQYSKLDKIKQNTIPAADTNYDANGGGVSVVTYTENAGVLGERYICDAAADENNDCGDDNLVTRDLLGQIETQVSEATNLPETTVTYKTCTEWLDGAAQTDQNCILWNLSDKNVYGPECDTLADCVCTGSGGYSACSRGRCIGNCYYE